MADCWPGLRPAVIRNDAECRRVEAEITKLLRKGERLTPEEERLLDLLSALVERYEDETEDFPASPPHRILRFLMEPQRFAANRPGEDLRLERARFRRWSTASAGSAKLKRRRWENSSKSRRNCSSEVGNKNHQPRLAPLMVMTPRSGWRHSKERTRKKGVNQGIVSMTRLAACQSASSSEDCAGADAPGFFVPTPLVLT